METQLKLVKEKLETKGFITRNECLNLYITRLSAIIFKLKEMGYEIIGRRIPTSKDKYDYRYELVKKFS